MILTANPGLTLLIGLAVLLFLGWVFWPQWGLIAQWSKARLNTQRILIEDALKFLFDCEYKNIPCGLHSIAGNLNIPSDKAARLLDRLRSIGLIRMAGDSFQLTDTGNSYALRIIRVHRIWEKFLAEETGIDQMEWHGAADAKEHELSLEAADLLAAQMGNPVFDPHGDPIPSSNGELPVHKGIPLSALKKGDIARIIHIEDEPPLIYAQLAALDMFPGMQIFVLDVSGEKIHFAANGEECVLSPLFASSITVEKIPDQTPLREKSELLSSLKPGEKAEVKGISPQCRGRQRRRLMDLGLVPGAVIKAEFQSALGDPVAYQIMGATIAIRKDQADYIYIRRIEKE